MADDVADAATGAPSTAELIGRAIEILDGARPVPLSTSVMVSKDELIVLLGKAITALPEDLREARRILKSRDKIVATAEREGDEILTLARSRAERLVERNEIVKAAELRARRIVDEAETEAVRLKRETEDLCDSRLAEFEILVERVRLEVTKGRAVFEVPRRRRPAPPPEEPIRGPFDQDAASGEKPG